MAEGVYVIKSGMPNFVTRLPPLFLQDGITVVAR